MCRFVNQTCKPIEITHIRMRVTEIIFIDVATDHVDDNAPSLLGVDIITKLKALADFVGKITSSGQRDWNIPHDRESETLIFRGQIRCCTQDEIC